MLRLIIHVNVNVLSLTRCQTERLSRSTIIKARRSTDMLCTGPSRLNFPDLKINNFAMILIYVHIIYVLLDLVWMFGDMSEKYLIIK